MIRVITAVILLQSSVWAQARSTVSGRVSPAPGPVAAALNALRIAVISSGSPSEVRDAPVAADGSFRISNVAPGPHAIRVLPGVLATVQESGFPAIGVFADGTDVTGIELSGPIAVPGRVLVEGGYGFPTTRIEAAPVMLSANPPGAAGFAFGTTIGPDGSFVLFVTPGEYRLRPPRLPAGYAVRGISYSGTDLLRNTFRVMQPSPAEIVMTLTAPAGGVTVRGRVSGLPANSPPNALGITIGGVSVPVRSDGTFEFPGVPPGNRDLLLTGGTSARPVLFSGLGRIGVADSDVNGVQLQSTPLTDVFTRIAVVDETGRQITTVPGNVRLAISSRDGSTINSCDDFPCRPNTVNVVAGGSNPASLPRIEYNVRADQIPAGYTVTAITCGGVDLLREPLKINRNAASVEIQVRLETTTRSRVAGKIVSTPASSVLPKAVMLRGSGSPVFQAGVSADGTFEFLGVPPGTYTATTIPAGPPPYGSQTTGLFVGETGSTDVHVLALSPAQLSRSTEDANEAAAVLNLVAVQKAAVYYNRVFGKFGDIAALVAVGLLDARYTWRISDYDITTIASGNDFAVMAAPASPDVGRYVFYTGAAPGTLGYTKAFPAVASLIPTGGLRRDPKGRLAFEDGTSVERLSTCGPACLRLDHPSASRPIQVSGQVSLVDGTPTPFGLYVGFELADGGGNLAAVKPDGTFSVAIPSGEARLVLSGLPFGYGVTSASAGATDLLKALFPASDSAPIHSQIMVTLAPNKPR